MDLQTRNPNVGRFRAISAIGRYDAAYSTAKQEYDGALNALPHRHSGIENTKAQIARLRAADEERTRHWDRLATLFDAELNRLGRTDPVVMGEITSRIISNLTEEGTSVRDFTPTNAQEKRRDAGPSAQRAQQGFTFTGSGDESDNDPMVAALKSSIAEDLAPYSVTGISFVEGDDLTDARARIQGNEAGFVHIGDSSRRGHTLCGYRIAPISVANAQNCHACELLDG